MSALLAESTATLVIPRGVFSIDLAANDCHDPEWQTTAKRKNCPNQTIVRFWGMDCEMLIHGLIKQNFS